MNPLHPRDGSLTVHDVQFHYRRWEAVDVQADLPPVLLLHGLASSSYICNLGAPRLAQAGDAVIALDQRGHGESGKPDHGYDFASILADDRAITRELDLRRPIVAGHSWGAMAALEYAAAPGTEVSSLLLIDGAAQQLSQRPGWSLEQALVDLAPPRYAGVTRETFLGFFASSPLAQRWTPELEASVLHIVEQHEDGTISPRLSFENHLQIIRAMWDQPTMELYARVPCPVQIILAERAAADDASRERAALRERGLEQIRTQRPGAQIIRMKDTIHDIPLQRPEQLAQEMLAFMQASTR